MDFINKLKETILEEKFEVRFSDKFVFVSNYNYILDITDTSIVIKEKNKKINIKGQNLIVKKLLCKEVLIKGVINSIELS